MDVEEIVDGRYEEEVIDITTNINERQEFRDEYNPTGQVPILCDGDLRVWENVVIGCYLNEKYDCADHWFGNSLEERARINMFVQWYAYTLRLSGGAFHWTIFAPMIYGAEKTSLLKCVKASICSMSPWTFSKITG